ncbi:gamma-glutamyltransferase, partial [Gemmatimonas sp.]
MSVIPRLSRTLRGAAFLASFAPGLVATPARAQSAPKPATPAEGAKGMVVSASAIASQVGREVLANGGNAVDAAIATGFALAVTYPTAGNIGGGGFMVIRFPDGRATTIDFRERAPAAATPTMFTDSTGAYSARIHHGSHKAVGVP